jgi:hypothetical protein
MGHTHQISKQFAKHHCATPGTNGRLLPFPRLVDYEFINAPKQQQYQHDCRSPRIPVKPALKRRYDIYDDVDGEAHNARHENSAH